MSFRYPKLQRPHNSLYYWKPAKFSDKLLSIERIAIQFISIYYIVFMLFSIIIDIFAMGWGRNV